ncbi:hypothetical protein JRO89_XS10G0020200 [Xanthoceras sorbifolium]|uniref:Uncharacterized protein n=1 Tax=Xanthoceras sorbifolium TaxID=99658 RepID=A0ABQ8HH89_9ROSI|nr:hypothetical protein JRO89_XS10G0020200 [Xanthoceras sorbifolium]
MKDVGPPNTRSRKNFSSKSESYDDSRGKENVSPEPTAGGRDRVRKPVCTETLENAVIDQREAVTNREILTSIESVVLSHIEEDSNILVDLSCDKAEEGISGDAPFTAQKNTGICEESAEDVGGFTVGSVYDCVGSVCVGADSLLNSISSEFLSKSVCVAVVPEKVAFIRIRYEDEPAEPDIEEGAEEDVDNTNNEDVAGEPVEAEENEEQEKKEATRKTSKFMTKYERARILGTRALQISMNAPVMVELEGETDPLEIAMKELRERKIPFTIRRYLPDGSYEEWGVDELIVEDSWKRQVGGN